jgi:hypothetical protein
MPPTARPAPFSRRRSTTRCADRDPAAAHRTAPRGDYDVAVFDNLFPTLRARRPRPARAARADGARARRLRGGGVHPGRPRPPSARCPSTTSSCCCRSGPTAPAPSARAADVAYVLPFENRGVEVGVTLHHPHGQIYAYPFVPPVPARDARAQRAYGRATGPICWSTTCATSATTARGCSTKGARGRLRPRPRALRVRGLGRADAPHPLARRPRRRRARPTSRARSRPCC